MSVFERKERFMVNYQNLQLKKLVKEKQIKARVSRRTGGIQNIQNKQSQNLILWKD